MEFRILGPLEVVDAHGPVDLGPPKQRALLAILLLHRNEAVSAERLIDLLWGGRPPETAHKGLQIYVSQLRKALEPAPRAGAPHRILVTRPSGYLAAIAPGQLDLDAFEAGVAAARDALADGRNEEASDALDEALALWRGPPLADFTFESFAQADIARLAELRLAAVQDRLTADLALGRHAELIGEIEGMVQEHPLRERLRAQLMLALYRSGRQAEALEVYQSARAALVEELGIEPGRELRDLHQAILQQDPGIVLAAGAEATDEPERGIFVGRDAELAELVSGLDDACAGRGRLFLLLGEPGIGKSRLAEELTSHARGRGARVLVGRCWEAGGAPAYWPWVQALRGLIRDVDPQALRAQLGAGAGEIAQILPELGELFGDLPAPARVDPDAARFRLLDSTVSFLKRAAAAQPLVLALDDLHAADEPSLLLLRFLASELGDSRILVVGTLRDVDPTVKEPLESTLAELGRERVTRRITLSGLDRPDVGSFIERAAGMAPPPEIVAAIHAETEGNPLFVGEFVRLLAAENRLEQLDEVAPSLGIPAGAREVIARRLRSLSEPCQEVLVHASVLGREFDLEVLARVGDVSRDDLLRVLDEAIEERVVSDIPGAAGGLRFSHALIRDALYEGLPTGRRMRLHVQAGEALEALHARDPDAVLAELAHHFFAAAPAGSRDKAVDYARRAGDHAAGQLAYEEAARLYAMALTLIADDRERCGLLVALGDAQARAGDTPASKRTYRAAAELAGELGLSEPLARAALGYGGRIVWEVSRDDEYLLPLLERALDALGDEDSPMRARLLVRLGGGPLRDSRFPPVQKTRATREALAMARRLGDPATLAWALAGYIPAHQSPSFTHQQVELATELIRIATDVGDSERAIEGYEYRFVASLELGDVARAKADVTAMAVLAERLRQPSQGWYVASDRAMIALLEGRLTEAEELICAARSLGERAQGWHAAVTYRLQLYVLRREQGRLEEIEPLIRSSVEEYPTYRAWLCVLVHMVTQLGHVDEARKAFEALAEDDFAEVPFDEEWLVGMTLLAEAACALGDTRRAGVIYELLLPYADRVAVSYAENITGSVARYLGLLAATMGRGDVSAGHFEDALAVNERIGARPWLAHTREDYGRSLLARDGPGDREKAEPLLSLALADYDELGIRGFPTP